MFQKRQLLVITLFSFSFNSLRFFQIHHFLVTAITIAFEENFQICN